jgi:hypothetical protein
MRVMKNYPNMARDNFRLSAIVVVGWTIKCVKNKFNRAREWRLGTEEFLIYLIQYMMYSIGNVDVVGKLLMSN